MLQIILFFIFLAVMALVFWILNLWIGVYRYPKEARYLHCRSIVFLVLALCIACNPFMTAWYFQWIDRIINAEKLKTFWDMVLPHRAYTLTYMLLMLLFLNVALMLFSIVVLMIEEMLRGRRTAFINTNDCTIPERILHFPWLLASAVYVPKDEDTAVLNQRGFTMGLWAKGIKAVFLVIAGLEILVTAILIVWGSDAVCEAWMPFVRGWNLIPMAGFLIVEQIQWFMEADLNAEAGTFSSENIEENLRGDMSVLVDLCRNFFGGSKALLYADKGKNIRLHANGMSSNDLGNRQKEDCKHPDILEMLWNQIKSTGVKQSDYLQNALVELLNGKCINVRDHIQGEFLIYLAAYLNYHMSQGRTVLVLCSDATSAEAVCTSIRQRMKLLNNVYTIWDIQDIEGANIDSPMSMLVCSCEDFLDYHIMTKRRDFTEDLFCTVIADGFDLFTREGVRIERLFSELYRAKRMEQYIIMTDEDNDGLRTTMERYLKTEILPFNDDERKANSAIMVWSDDSTSKLQRMLQIGNSRSPHLGTALPIALVAAKFDLPQIYIVPDRHTADWTFRDAMAMSQQEVTEFLERPMNLSGIIRYDVDEAMSQKDLSMVIAYDNSYNIFNTVWSWLKYGPENGSMLHVISPTYMLRDYFAANFDQLLMKNNEYDALIPVHLGMKRSQMEAILIELCSDGLTESELNERARRAGWKYDTTIELLEDCLNVVLTKGEFHNVFECFHFEEEKTFMAKEKRFRHETRVTLSDDNIRIRLLAGLKHACMVEKGDQSTELDILAANVTNYCLRDQIVPFNGYYYRIHRIKDGMIYGDQCMPGDLPQYYPVSRFVFDEASWEEKDSCVDTPSIDWNLLEARMGRRIYGYWSCNAGNALTDHEATTWNSICDAAGEPQLVVQEKCHVLEINLRKVDLDNKGEETATLAVAMINEIAKTLFPRTWQNLYAMTAFGPEESFYRTLGEQLGHMAPEDIIRSSIPCAENARKQSADAVTIYLAEFSSVEFGMVQSFYDNREKILSLLHEYLEWYMKENAGTEKTVEKQKTRTEHKKETAKADQAQQEAATTTEAKEAEVEDAVKEAEKAVREAREKAEESQLNSFREARDIVDKAGRVLEKAMQDDKDNEEKTNAHVDYRRFLRFGMASVPGIFALQQLKNLCRKNIAVHEDIEPEDSIPVTAQISRCTFCGKPALFTVDLHDGRCMCAHCKDHQIQQKDEIKQLFCETKQLLERDYGISLRKNIHVRFQSAETIRRATGVMEGGRVLGFYNRVNHQLWIEARGPRICVQSTLIHELSHTWQFDELDIRKMYDKLPGDKEQKDALQLMILEGHAVYMEIETMRRLHEYDYANYMEAYTLMREDEYGKGYRLISDYLKGKEAEGSHMTPYEAMRQLVDGILDGTVSLQ